MEHGVLNLILIRMDNLFRLKDLPQKQDIVGAAPVVQFLRSFVYVGKCNSQCFEDERQIAVKRLVLPDESLTGFIA